MYVLRFDLYNLRTKHPSIRIILYNYFLIVSVKPDYVEIQKESLYLWINDEKTLINGKRYQSFSSTTGLMDLDSYTKYEMDTEMVLMQEYDGVELPAGETEIHLVLDVGSSAPISEKNRSENITEFVYDFTITAEQLKEQTIRKKMNMEISGGDGCNLILKELAMNDLHSRITALGVTPDDKWLNEYELKLKGTDSFGNPVSFEGAGFGPENELRFETSVFGDYEEGDIVDADNFQMSLPDKNCQYLDLQLYQRKIRWDLQSAEQLDDEYYVQEKTDSDEIYSKENNYGWEPVGEKFRIQIDEDLDIADKIIGGADEPTYIDLK